ncbi:MAG: FecCD family ABC transporter permease [Acidimicrobiales bacterium]
MTTGWLGLASLTALLVSILLGIGLGPVTIGPDVVYGVLFEELLARVGVDVSTGASFAQREIVTGIRLPRVLLGVVVGGGLAGCGVVLQALLRNPLADPYLIGVSSGASFGVVAALAMPAIVGFVSLPLAAFLAGMGAFVIVVLVARTGARLDPLRLVLTGVAVGAMFTAASQWIILSFPDNGDLRRALTWMLGSLTGQKLTAVALPAVVTALALVVFWTFAPRLDALAVGEETARSLGVSVGRLRTGMIVLVALTVGVLVSVSGAIGFVALIVPHGVRLLVGTAHRRLLPLAAMWGAIFLVWADVLARVVRPGQEIPLGVLTAMLGAPVFLVILRRTT